ncbi:hypothetical protein IJF81_06755 [bacterium]|nr:hypothetical protein [bacterium]
MKKIGTIIGIVIILVFIAGVVTSIYTIANMDNTLPKNSCEVCTTEPCPCYIK